MCGHQSRSLSRRYHLTSDRWPRDRMTEAPRLTRTCAASNASSASTRERSSQPTSARLRSRRNWCGSAAAGLGKPSGPASCATAARSHLRDPVDECVCGLIEQNEQVFLAAALLPALHRAAGCVDDRDRRELKFQIVFREPPRSGEDRRDLLTPERANSRNRPRTSGTRYRSWCRARRRAGSCL